MLPMKKRRRGPAHKIVAFPPFLPELALEIIDQLGNQLQHGRTSYNDPAVYEAWRALLACAYVSRRFRDAALPHLLGSLSFSYSCSRKLEGRDFYSTFVISDAVLVVPTPIFATRLRRVAITGQCFGAPKIPGNPLFPLVSLPGLAKTLGTLTNLEDLSLKGIAFDSDSSLDKMLSCAAS